MIIHPELRALRGNDTPQRIAQRQLLSALSQWRAMPGTAPVLAALERYAAGESLESCTALAALFDPLSHPSTMAFVGTFMQAHLATMEEFPLGHPAMRHFTDGTVSTLLLARKGPVTLTLVAMDGRQMAQRPTPTSLAFNALDSSEHILAGKAEVELFRRRPNGSRDDAFERTRQSLRPGVVLQRCGDSEAWLVHSIMGCLVSLRLQRRKSQGASIECDLKTGEEIRQSTGSPQDSRNELMLSLLGRMRRIDAAPLMAEMVSGKGGASLRWQALRECLALDTLTGFQTLQELALTETDPLNSAAVALRNQLLAAHPAFAAIEAKPRNEACPA